jgi:hypothetical protein
VPVEVVRLPGKCVVEAVRMYRGHESVVEDIMREYNEKLFCIALKSTIVNSM